MDVARNDINSSSKVACKSILNHGCETKEIGSANSKLNSKFNSCEYIKEHKPTPTSAESCAPICAAELPCDKPDGDKINGGDAKKITNNNVTKNENIISSYDSEAKEQVREQEESASNLGSNNSVRPALINLNGDQSSVTKELNENLNKPDKKEEQKIDSAEEENNENKKEKKDKDSVSGGDVKTNISQDARPIYPNVPYSPYASPYGSPRCVRRRPPLRESRRVSIEQTGSFQQLNQYKLMDQIGQGSYGLVKLAYSEEDSTHYAMKILSKRRLMRQAGLAKRGPKKITSPLDRVYREIAVLKKLDHPNVVKLIEVLDDPLEDSLYMVFELVTQGEVLTIPTKQALSEERACSVFRDVLLGLEYLHYQRIIHADIKPANLLLTEDGRVKIADLGVCNEFAGEDATISNGSTAGTPAFRAPETITIGQHMYCGKMSDIWSLGATLFSLVYGNVPFLANSIPVLYEKIKSEPLSFPPKPQTSNELKDCIKRMLTKEPNQRITIAQLKDHDWVTNGGMHVLPSEDENCCLVQVSEDDISSVVRSIPKLDTLILIKTMLKKHSFGNPFMRGISGRAPQRGGSRLERFVRAGRSNSAPGACTMPIDRQLSSDNMLPCLAENCTTTNE